MAGDDVTIIIRADNGDAIRAFRDTEGRLRDMGGRFRSEGSVMSRSMNQLAASLGGVRGSLVPLATAAVPVAAAMAPIAAKTGAAGLAVAAFGAALKPQISNLQDVSAAQDKYNDAVDQYGARSKQAVEAQQAVAQTLRSMPKETQRAAVAYGMLRDETRAWSDDMARFTMAPVEKSFAVMGQVVPELTPMVRGASTELDRLMTVAGGAVASPGFDALSEKVSAFANESLRDAVDGAIHFSRVLSEGDASGPIRSFMEYAQQSGPALRETMSSVGDAVSTLVEAAAAAGPGMLTLVNAAAGLVAALPPELVTVALQVAVGLKMISLAGAGVAAVAGGVSALGARLSALGAASAAAGGGLAGLRAAFLSLGVAARASVVVAGIAAIAVAVHKLSSMGREAPPNVDRLTTSLGKLGQSGKVGGEAARVFGDDLSKLYDKIRSVSDPSTADKVQQGLVKVFSLGMADSTPVKEAKERLDAIDTGLTNLVKGGKADIAAAAFERLKKAYAEEGKASEFTSRMDDYKSALADMKFEQELAAQSMGLFGAQSLAVQEKLNAQKASADGLRQSIVALNDVNRAASGAMNAFEQSIDDVAKVAQENGGALRMVDGQLDLNSKRARDAEAALRALSQNMDGAATAAREAGEPWEKVNGIYARGREKFVAAAEALGLSESQARQLAKTMMRIPDSKKLKIEMRTEDAVAGLDSVISAMKKTPKSKSVTVKALTRDAVDMLKSLGLKVTRLKDGSFRVTAKTRAAHSSIGAVRRARDGLKNKTISIGANTAGFRAAVRGMVGRSLGTSYVDVVYRRNPAVGAALLGGMRAFGASGGLASALPRKRFAAGGEVQAFPNGGSIRGPGTNTSDSILGMFPSGAMARVSDSEYVVQARAVRKYGVRFLDALNSGQLLIPGLKRGGLTKAQQRAKERAEAESRARKEAAGELTISYFGQRAGYRNPEIRNQLGAPDSLGDLTSSLNKWRSVIKRATHGGVERSLLRSLDRAGRSLISHEKKILGVNKALDKAKDKLGDLRSAASQLRSSVKDRVVSDAGITRAAGSDDARLTINTLLSQMTGSAASAKQFASMLKSLKSRGLSKDLIAQIAEAGVEGGGLETAAAVLGGGKGEIQRLNALQKEIVSAAGSAGTTAADAMYGAGIKAAEGLVKGLQKKQDAIEKQMMKIAKSMEKAIKRALKIKSPSQVMEEIGDYTAEGFALGMRRNRSVTPAWASMLNVPPQTTADRGASASARAGGAAGWDGRPIVVQLRIGERDLGEVVIDPLRRAIAHRGGNVQSALGRP
ncbi:hypothetical protein [Streptomyces alboflavus]|uniref:hypothetical protein n=1 Tax=Streptomyces alboflavus TaxID=67267 RepID=UPI0004C1D43A|nr:hypothetical protein [Streptomyces alboflavus]